jgi:hypothetical protein
MRVFVISNCSLWMSHLPFWVNGWLTEYLCMTWNVGRINPLTPELNPSAQRCLTRFFTGDFDSWTVHSLLYALKTNKCNNYSFSLLIMYGISYVFGITSPCSGSVPSVFWEMLKWGAVDRILWMGVLCLLAWCGAISDRQRSPRTTSLLTDPQMSISEGSRNAPWGWLCNDETCRSYHT